MLDIIYADTHLVVVNKPCDMLSVPGKGIDKQDCVWRRVQQQGFPTARIVHRLDYATSGLMVLALTADSHIWLNRQFQQRRVHKRYQAIISGQPLADQGVIEQPLRCDWERRPLQIVDPVQGKAATTHWQVDERLGDRCRVTLTPITGRSHQLRVHMQWLGHPIAGDRFYADPVALALSERLLLHARELAFYHPNQTGEQLSFCHDVPF